MTTNVKVTSVNRPLAGEVNPSYTSNEWRYQPVTWTSASMPAHLPPSTALLPEERRVSCLHFQFAVNRI